ncbi:MAG TPA: AAA family ATPase [Fimbriimonadaceae bacterium]|jgi:predicted ATPase
MTERRFHKSLHLHNFTAFSDVVLDFVDDINVFVGENGTGKTHVLKALFAWEYFQSRDPNGSAPGVYLKVFKAETEAELVRLGTDANSKCLIEGQFGSHLWKQYLLASSPQESFGRASELTPVQSRPVFIPAVDMIGHTRRFTSTYDEYNIDFDLTYRDIVSLLLSPERRLGASSRHLSLLALLDQKIGGRIEEESERFYLNTEHGKQSMPLVAEGLRKLATLRHLIANGFLDRGATLFWDEPEVNVNPALMGDVVHALLELGRNGVQVFIATHSYVILKELEVQKGKGDSLRLFAFESTKEGTKVHPAESYSSLAPNPIEAQYLSLYDRDIERRIQGNSARA